MDHAINICVLGDIYSYCNSYPSLYKNIGVIPVFWLINTIDTPFYIDRREILEVFPNCDVVRRILPDVGEDYLFNNLPYEYDSLLTSYIDSYMSEIFELNERMKIYSVSSYFGHSSAKEIQSFVILAMKIRAYLLKKEVRLIYFSMEPHTVFEFLFYLVGQYLGVTTVVQKYTLAKNLSFFSKNLFEYYGDNYRSQSPIAAGQKDRLDQNWVDIVNQIQRKNEPDYFRSYEEMGLMKSQYIENIVNTSKGLISHFKFQFKMHTLSFSKSCKLVVNQLIFFAYSLKCKYDYLKNVRSLSIKYIPSAKYVYLALPWQPEMTTLPNAREYRNLVFVAKVLRDSFPSDVLILIKEHPAQNVESYAFLNRFEDFYKEINKMNNVLFISQEVSTFLLQKNALAIATVNGTVGFEAAVLGKPVIIFSSAWYEKIKGVNRVINQKDCIRYANEIMNGECEVCHQEDLEEYLSSLTDTCRYANTIHTVREPHAVITDKYFETLKDVFEKVLT